MSRQPPFSTDSPWWTQEAADSYLEFDFEGGKALLHGGFHGHRIARDVFSRRMSFAPASPLGDQGWCEPPTFS